MIHEDWKKEMEQRLRDYPKTEKIPQAIKRCPKCHSLSLNFDLNSGRIYCTKCGFEEFVPMLK